VLKRILWLLVAFPVGALLVTLAVANRHPVRLVLNPFRPDNPDIYVDLPLYAYLFSMLILGVVLGGLATWFGQGHWRRLARHRAQQAMRWQAEADRLTRERDAQVEGKKLALARR
jgi:hypothetical protein